jgi:WD40-like Beta Propeller Repeat
MSKYLNSIVTITLLLCWSGGFDYNVAAQRTSYASNKPLNEPTIFAPRIISAGDYDSHPAFMPDGKTLYFVRSDPSFSFWTILVSRFERGQWREPQVAPFSGQYL